MPCKVRQNCVNRNRCRQFALDGVMDTDVDYTPISGKAVRKSAPDNLERYCEWL